VDDQNITLAEKKGFGIDKNLITVDFIVCKGALHGPISDTVTMASLALLWVRKLIY
jgi:hypothetical protein